MGRHGSPPSELSPPARNYLYDKPLTAIADRAARPRVPSPLPPTTPTTAGNVAGSPFSSLSRPLAGRSDAGLDARRAVAVHPAHRRNRVPPKKERDATPDRIRLTGARQPTPLASSHRAGSNANVPPSLSVTCDLQECLETRRGVGTELRALEEQETHSCVTQRSRSTWRY